MNINKTDLDKLARAYQLVRESQEETGHNGGMSKTFKEVLVYTGYGEFGVENVETFVAANLQDAVKLVEKKLLDSFEGDPESYEEFYGQGSIKNGIGSVQSGEENVILVFGEDSIWFDRFDHDWTKWSDDVWNEWLELWNA